MMDDFQWYHVVMLLMSLAAIALSIDNQRRQQRNRRELEAYWARRRLLESLDADSVTVTLHAEEPPEREAADGSHYARKLP